MADTKPPCLTVLGGPMAGNRFVLQDGVANILIGSDPVCAFHLPLPGVGAMHARLTVEPQGVSLWEAGSSRGVHVNDSKVEGSAPLRNGDIIWLGTPGDEDVVMLQVILPRVPSLEVAAAPVAEVDEASDPAVEGETVALDPRSMSLEPEAATPSAEAPEGGEASEAESPEPVTGNEASEPLAIPLDSPLDAHFARVSPDEPPGAPPVAEPEEAGVVVDSEAESFVTPQESLGPLGGLGNQEFVLADEGLPLTVQVEAAASSYTLPVSTPSPAAAPPDPPAAPIETVIMPPGFEDETEERLVMAETVMKGPEPAVEPPAYRASYDIHPPPPPPAPPAAPAPVVPKAAPAPAARPATAPTPRASRPATTPPSRKPGPSVSQRTAPADKTSPPPASSTPKSSSTGLYVGLGLGALVVLGGGGYALTKMMGAKPAAVAQATPAPVTPTEAPPVDAPLAAPLETPPPPLETPSPEVAPTVAAPTPVPTPTARPTPTPTPVPTPTAKPTPTPAAIPAGPSPEQVRAQQVAGLLSQADAAMGARQFDRAIGHFDAVLRLDPSNAKATRDRAAATAARAAARRRFVAGRTTVTTQKEGSGALSGFEGAAVQKAPDFLGRIEFDMSPSSGLKPGDSWTLKIFVVNEGKKAIRITDLAATTVVDGERSGGAAGARVRDIAPQARVQVGEMAGAWKDGTQTWLAEVLLTAKDDSLKNTLTWR